MILSAQSIRKRKIFNPFYERSVFKGMSYGLSACGYDVRIRQTMVIEPGHFELASIVESMDMPLDLVGRVHDKSSWARRGLAVQNTVIEPGWKGYLTLELTNHSQQMIVLESGMPIAQIIFEKLDEVTEQPYSGKYQDQPDYPVGARWEKMQTNG